MQKACGNIRYSFGPSPSFLPLKRLGFYPVQYVRCASIYQAIDRGIRRSKPKSDGRGTQQDRPRSVNGRGGDRTGSRGLPSHRSREQVGEQPRLRRSQDDQGFARREGSQRPARSSDWKERGTLRDRGSSNTQGGFRRESRKYQREQVGDKNDPRDEPSTEDGPPSWSKRGSPTDRGKLSSQGANRRQYQEEGLEFEEDQKLDNSGEDRHSKAPRRDDRRPKDRRSSHDQPVSDRPLRQNSPSKFPDPNEVLSIPYTTPASEFLYGTSVVAAALRSGRRQLYKLYVYKSSDNPDSKKSGRDARQQTLFRDAQRAGVRIVNVKADGVRLMDKMSHGRPHNGLILEASPLPKVPILGLESTEQADPTFSVTLGYQSQEEVKVNGTSSTVENLGAGQRYPLVVMLDGVLDPGNLGAVVRSAYFLGVDAIAISTHSAPFTPVTLKASAGAAENMPLLSIKEPAQFVDNSRENGWRVFAAVAPNEDSYGSKRRKALSASDLGNALLESPCILMMGSEGEGIRRTLQKKADVEVGIEGGRIGEGGVDSLNLSVAAAILCDGFLRSHRSQAMKPTKSANRIF